MIAETHKVRPSCARLVVIWTNLGPYHLARIRALSTYFEVHAIELASSQRLYGWQPKKEGAEWSIHTLRDGAWEDQDKASVAISLWRKLSAIGPTIVLVPGYADFSSLLAALWAQTHGAVAVLMSDSNIHDYARSRITEALKRILVSNLFSGAIVAGRNAKAYVGRLGLRESSVQTGYDVVDNEFFAEETRLVRSSARALQHDKSTPYFLYVGRLAPEKNVAALLRAFRSYRESGGNCNLLVAGSGPLLDELRLAVLDYEASGVVSFVGHKTVLELIPYYAYAQCLILPSLREPWGLVVNEAMACGLPVIVSSRCGCADDLVERGRNGFVFDPETPNDLELVMTEMSTSCEERRVGMGARSTLIITRWTPNHFASQVHRVSRAIDRMTEAE